MSYDLSALPPATLPYVQWALNHWQQLPQIAIDVAAVRSAQGVDASWTATKTAGDLIVTVLDDFPGLTPAPVTPESAAAIVAAHPAVAANGQIINILIQNLPAILAFIQQIVPLFKG